MVWFVADQSATVLNAAMFNLKRPDTVAPGSSSGSVNTELNSPLASIMWMNGPGSENAESGPQGVK